MALGNIHSDSDGQRGVEGCTETGEEIKKKGTKERRGVGRDKWERRMRQRRRRKSGSL